MGKTQNQIPVIALTGGIGSGKSFVAKLFGECGAAIVDADAVARTLTNASGAAIPLIAQKLGAEFIDATGALDRTKMRERAFKNVELKRELETILHPLIRAEMNAQIRAISANKNTAAKYIIAEIPLLFAARDYFDRYAYIVTVDCTVAKQIVRVMARSNLSKAVAQSIIDAQTPRQLRLQLADDCVCNEVESGFLQSQVRHLHEKYLKLTQFKGNICAS